MCPVSVRTEDEQGRPDNRVSAMFVHLRTDMSSVPERLQAIARATKGAKADHSAVGAKFIQNWAEQAAPSTFVLATRLYSRLNLADRHPPHLQRRGVERARARLPAVPRRRRARRHLPDGSDHGGRGAQRDRAVVPGQRRLRVPRGRRARARRVGHGRRRRGGDGRPAGRGRRGRPAAPADARAHANASAPSPSANGSAVPGDGSAVPGDGASGPGTAQAGCGPCDEHRRLEDAGAARRGRRRRPTTSARAERRRYRTDAGSSLLRP